MEEDEATIRTVELKARCVKARHDPRVSFRELRTNKVNESKNSTRCTIHKSKGYCTLANIVV